MTKVHDIVSNPTMTYQQQLLNLARLAEESDTSLPRDLEFVEALDEQILCDLGEGLAPYRPRYILPDYRILMEKGSAFLGLDAPVDIWEATNALLIMYKNVPSITSFPVWLGNFTQLLAPFDKDEAETRKAMKLFLLHVDKTLTDSFVHANIGPEDARINRIILDLTKEMQLAIPNITLIYDPERTSNEFTLACIDCMLATSKPSFANDVMYRKDDNNWEYGIASCYNALHVAGGGYTLPRLRLYNAALKANDVDDFITRVLPYYSELLLRNMDQRITYIVEESNFFKVSFLVKEGFVKQENFTGMFGVVGMAECVNHLLKIRAPLEGYGHNPEANACAERIMDALHALVNNHHGVYCEGSHDRYVLHAQVGIDSDGRENSPGMRIPIGCEPELFHHIAMESKMHKHFVSGIGDIFKFDDTWNQTPSALLDIINGSFDSGMRYFSAYNADNDVVRVTGYLVKRSEVEKYEKDQASLNNCTSFGFGAKHNSNALDRRVYDDSSRQ